MVSDFDKSSNFICWSMYQSLAMSNEYAEHATDSVSSKIIYTIFISMRLQKCSTESHTRQYEMSHEYLVVFKV